MQRADQTRLLEALRGATLVVVVDAIQTGLGPGTVHVLDPRSAPLLENPALSDHGFGLATAIELGRALGNLPDRLVIVGIEGADFATGAPLSSEVSGAVSRAVEFRGRDIHHAIRRCEADQDLAVQAPARPHLRSEPTPSCVASSTR